MKNAKRLIAVAALACVLLPLSAQAYPTQSGSCSNCHPHDAAVVVTATPIGCTVKNGQTQASYDYQLTISNTYEQLEGYGVFDGLTKVLYGYGNTATITLGQNKTFTLRGVSDSDLQYGGGKGGSNFVTVTTPFCAACVDADGDGFSATGGSCGRWDCNDAVAAVNPNAVDIPNNGVDENCNGYDLTIVVTKAAYSRGKRTLTVEATSALGASAGLSITYYVSPNTYYAPMTWNASLAKWQAVVTGVPANPGTVTVSGVEGQVTAPVTTGR